MKKVLFIIAGLFISQSALATENDNQEVNTRRATQSISDPSISEGLSQYAQVLKTKGEELAEAVDRLDAYNKERDDSSVSKLSFDNEQFHEAEDRVTGLMKEIRDLRTPYVKARVNLGECYWNLANMEHVVWVLAPLIKEFEKTFENERKMQALLQ